MGGIVSGIGDALGGVADAVGSVVSNPIVDAAGLGLATGGFGALAGAGDLAGAAAFPTGDLSAAGLFSGGAAGDLAGGSSLSSLMSPWSSSFAGLVPDSAGAAIGGSSLLSSFLSPQGILAASQLGGSALSGYAASQAASQQAAATQAALNQQQQMFNTVNNQQAPWRQAGQNSLDQLQAGLHSYGNEFRKTFGPNDLQSNLAPNYQFQLQQGLGALNNSATVGSGLVGGNALKAINDYAQNYAGNAYQNAFNNFNVGETNIFNRLASLAQLGQTSANQTANSALGFGTNIGDALIGQGQAQASGTVGLANAVSSGLNNAAGTNYLSSFLTPSASQ